MHPSRATRQTWDLALNEAVHQGLNLVTIYIIWADHQPFRDKPIDWTFPAGRVSEDGTKEPGGGWDLAQAIRAVADRGLLVHIRVGPYVCAEYSYGGIPEWVATTTPGMSLRRPNRLWMTVMEEFVTAATSYLIEQELFAYQGGPIILAQIENELGSDDDDDVMETATENILHVDRYGNFVNAADDASWRIATLQDYADWCGTLAQKLVPNVVWTMCFGLSANNTIETYNGFFYDTTWMDNHGGSGRIQIDHPAIWTEDEGTLLPPHPFLYLITTCTIILA